MPDVLVDTDVFVDHLRGYREFKWSAGRVWYSVVTRCELFAGSKVDEGTVRLLLAPFSEVSTNREIAETAGRLRRTHAVRTPDALIAACALERGLTLVTRNAKHFWVVPELVVREPE